MKKTSVEISVGIFIFIGIILICYMVVRLGDLRILGNTHYSLYANFENVSGLVEGATVEIAGVKVGYIESIFLDKEKKEAHLLFKIREGVQLDENVIASVKTYGLIGDKYVGLFPGGADKFLNPGDTIFETESTIDIEGLISKYIFGKV